MGVVIRFKEKHFDRVKEDKDKEQQEAREELLLDLLRDEEGMIKFFVLAAWPNIFLAGIRAQWLTSRLNRRPTYKANQLVRSSLWGSWVV